MASPCAAPFAIEVTHLTKQFIIHHKGSIKQRILGAFRPRSVEQFTALNDISFQVPHGQVLAIIGSNGSGKSTLLGLLARVYKPTSGEIKVCNPCGERARIAPLL